MILQTVIKVIVGEESMNHNIVYLDNASTTFPVDKCIEEFIECAREYYNPSSTYCEGGIAAHNNIETARGQIARFIGAKPSEIYFTSGGSEANTWAIKGILEANSNIHTIITTQIEHSSVYNAVKAVEKNDKFFSVLYTPIDSEGNVDIKLFDKLIRNIRGDVLVAIMYANNEIGTVQNISDLSYITKKYDGSIFFTDAVQAFGNININMKQLENVDVLSASGHKIGCFSGIGFLYVREGTKISPLINGGKQEGGLRGGTENYCYIVPFGKQVNRLYGTVSDKWTDIANKTIYLYNKITSGELDKYCNIKLNGNIVGDYRRLPNNLSIVFSGIDASTIITLLDERGFIVSAGSACNAGTGEPSRVLKKIGLSDEDANSTIRITISQDTQYSDLNKFYDNLIDIIRFLHGDI